MTLHTETRFCESSARDKSVCDSFLAKYYSQNLLWIVHGSQTKVAERFVRLFLTIGYGKNKATVPRSKRQKPR